MKDETTHLLSLLLLCHILLLLHIMVDGIDSFKADQFVVKNLISSLVSFGGCKGGLERKGMRLIRIMEVTIRNYLRHECEICSFDRVSILL